MKALHFCGVVELAAARKDGDHVGILVSVGHHSDYLFSVIQLVECGALVELVDHNSLHSKLEDAMASEEPYKAELPVRV